VEAGRDRITIRAVQREDGDLESVGAEQIGNREHTTGCGPLREAFFEGPANYGHLPESNQFSVAWNKKQNMLSSRDILVTSSLSLKLIRVSVD
jgi:hypothetical protein